MQGATEVALTVLDPLGYLDEIPICIGYEIDGEFTDHFPNSTELDRAKPVLKKLPGWKCDITGIHDFDQLPDECKNYVLEIEKAIGIPVTMISNGPDRDHLIWRKSSL